MTREEFIEVLEEVMVLDNGSIEIETRLDQLDEWDSLAQFALLSVFDEKFGVKLGATAFRDVETVSGLLELVKDHIE